MAESFLYFFKASCAGQVQVCNHAPVKRSYKRGFTTYHDRGFGYWIMSCTCKIVEKAPSPPAQFASMPHACQWAPFAARTAADGFCSFDSVPTSVCQAGDPGGVYLGQAATRVFHSVWFPAPCSRFTWCSLQIVTGAVHPPFPKLTYGLCNFLPLRQLTIERDAEDQWYNDGMAHHGTHSIEQLFWGFWFQSWFYNPMLQCPQKHLS